jgi:hypothetical protein
VRKQIKFWSASHKECGHMGDLGIHARKNFILRKQPVKRGLNKCPDILNMVLNLIPLKTYFLARFE